MKHVVMAAMALLLAAGCGEKKADAEKLNHANALVNTGQYDEGLTQLEEMFKSTPDDIALRQSLVSAHMKTGNFFMFNDTLSPKVKYPKALHHYRAVLKLAPEHADAKANADQIVEIYAMMGRPVPEV
ncbi:MAG: hypothetical protein F9K22_11675 [Bacteroidetes bacterium]|nr:MAG: hypothetical protein F9K22_11675 [Bacteroidota bacterium]